MENHDKDGNGNSLEQGPILEEAHVLVETEEEVILEGSVLILWKVGLRGSDFEEMLGFDFEVFNLDELVGLWASSELSQNLETFLVTSLLHEPTRGLWHEENTNAKGKSWDELDADWDEPCGVGLTITSSTYIMI